MLFLGFFGKYGVHGFRVSTDNMLFDCLYSVQATSQNNGTKKFFMIFSFTSLLHRPTLKNNANQNLHKCLFHSQYFVVT